MASGGSDLSTRMSAEDENIENKSINDIALKYFKKYKVEISDAIKTTFPFLELLRDHEFITNEMYEESQESFKKKCPVHVIIYNVLCELEKKFDMSLLRALFSKTIMKNYPDLFRIYKIFYKAIPDIEFLLENDGEEYEERPNDQLSLEQGTGGSSYQRLTWLGPDAWNYNDTAPPECGPLEHHHDTQEINATETDTTSDNEDALKSQQANEQCAQESKTAGAELLHHGNQTNSCSVNPMGMKKEKSFLYSGVECEAQARTDCNQASDVIVINSQDFEEFTDEDEPPIGSTSALKRKPESMDFRKSPTCGKILCKTGAEQLHQENQNTSCSVNPMGIKKEKSFLYSGVECEAQARTDCNQASDVIVIDSQDFAEFTDEDGSSEASTTALKRKPESVDFRKSPTSGQILCKTGAELLHQENQNTSCSVNPMGIKKEKSFLYSGVECEAQARTDCNQASDVIVIDSQDFAEFTDEDGSSEASTTALKRKPESMDFRKSPTSGKILCKTGRSIEDSSGFCAEKKPRVTCSSAVRNPKVSSGFSAKNKPPGPCSSAVRNPKVSSGFSAQAKPPGDCSSAVGNPEVSSGFSAKNKPPGPCSSAVRNPEVSSGFSAKNKPPGPCSSAVRNPEVSAGFSAKNKPPGPCSSTVRNPKVSAGFSAKNKPPGPCSSAVRNPEVSAGFSAKNKPPGPCSSTVRKPKVSSGFSAQNKPPGSCSSAVRSLEGSSGFATQNKPLGACSSALRIGPDEKGSRKHKEENANFHSEILPVTCGKIEGMLYVKKFEQGTKRKCIRSQDGNWFNPKEFEEKAGYGTSKSCWKTRVRSNGNTLKSLMKKGRLPTPPAERSRSKKLRSSEVCKICCREGNLFCCITCLSFFHGDCHLPPVETERSPWRCTLCRVKECSGSQQSARESEVLVRLMGPESQLKCEFLLLMLYCHSESNGFPNIQRDNYRIENFQCMADFLVLDEIKKKLIERRYLNVMEFMQDVRRIFLVHRASKKCNNFCWGIRQEEKFELNFKQVFAVQETEQEHTTKLN
ncbi:nuclear body protein SP140-like isoform X2 [Myotis yumanensis]|uniref:nuclear body protein SP140-like isoform X2 n=1 Tax=Myotis yumanensis TaxID=159337 RepID=UPI0038CFB07A